MWQSSERYPDPAVRVLDPAFNQYRLVLASVERLYTGCRWAEGPVWFGDGRYLLWSDIPNNRILRWDEETGAVSNFRKPSNNANGNTTFTVGEDNPTNFLLYDYEIGELGAEFNTQVGGLPLQLWAQYAQNLASDVEEDTAYNVGFRLGRASNPRTWEVGAMYQSIDKDALFGQLIDSDFGNGVTDTEGWALRGAYAPVRNIAVNLTYFINTLNKDVGTGLDYDRLQLDLNWKY